jgi:hypothetical protein
MAVPPKIKGPPRGREIPLRMNEPLRRGDFPPRLWKVPQRRKEST